MKEFLWAFGSAGAVSLISLVGIAISLGVLIVGPMLTFAAFVIPPLAARRFCKRMGSFFILSSLIGCVCGLIGFYFSYHFDLPLGPTNIALFSVVLAGAVLLKKAIEVLSKKAEVEAKI